MFYVSSQNGNLFGVTNTETGIEEFYTDEQIAMMLKSNTADIYGTSYYNYKANCTPLKINIALSKSKLESLIENWRNSHNQWKGHSVEDYLAQAKIGTRIRVDYSYVGDGDRRLHSSSTVIKKDSWDSWHYEDLENTFSGTDGDSRFAAWTLEVACLCSKSYIIRIK
jgi:hypothetical protein